MSRNVKISFDVNAVNRRVDRSNGQTCVKDCPKLAERNQNGVTWRQIKFCPILCRRIMADTATCPYGRRLIASESAKEWKRKAKSRQTGKNARQGARRKRG